MGAILQPNMMVVSQVENSGEESAGMYNTSQSTAEENGNIDREDNSANKDSNEDMEAEASILWQFRFEIAYKRWLALYDREGALKLKSAMMKRMFKQKMALMQFQLHMIWMFLIILFHCKVSV